MFRRVAKALLADAVQSRTGIVQGGAVSAALLSTGVSLLLVRGRRPAGLALIAAGGLLRWAEIERHGPARRAAVRPTPSEPAGGASPATGSR